MVEVLGFYGLGCLGLQGLGNLLEGAGDLVSRL